MLTFIRLVAGIFFIKVPMKFLTKINTLPLSGYLHVYMHEKIVTGTRRREHITPVLRQLHWLPVRQCIKFKLAVLAYKAKTACIQNIRQTTASLQLHLLPADDDYDRPASPRVRFQELAQVWVIAHSLLLADLEFSRLESWSRDVSRPIFTSLGLGLGLEPQSLGLSWSWNPRVSVSVLVLGLGTMETRSSSLMKREIETK